MTEAARQRMRFVIVTGLIIGGLGFAALLCSLFLSAAAFFHAYLVAFIFWLGVALGGLGWLMIHHLSGGRWGWPMRRAMEVAASTLPAFALAFIPLLLGITQLYPWAASVDAGHTLEHQRQYLNAPLVIARAVLYFAIWTAFALLLIRADARISHAQPPAAAGLSLLIFTISFAAFDWVMALEAKWYSTIIGLYVAIGFAAAAWSALILITTAPLRHITFAQLGMERQIMLNDLGNLLLACVVLHAYIAFSQFFIIWNGNTRHEILWYLPRERGAWGALVVVLMLLYFFIPFGALLLRFVKRRPAGLMSVAIVVLVSQVLSLAWMVLPSMNRAGAWLEAMGQVALAVIAVISFGGLWSALFAWRWTRMPEPEDRPRTALSEQVMT